MWESDHVSLCFHNQDTLFVWAHENNSTIHQSRSWLAIMKSSTKIIIMHGNLAAPCTTCIDPELGGEQGTLEELFMLCNITTFPCPSAHTASLQHIAQWCPHTSCKIDILYSSHATNAHTTDPAQLSTSVHQEAAQILEGTPHACFQGHSITGASPPWPPQWALPVLDACLTQSLQTGEHGAVQYHVRQGLCFNNVT